VKSGGNIDLQSSDKESFNGIGGNVSINAGSGISNQGGSGGSVMIKAGRGLGEAQFGGAVGLGGQIGIVGGDAIEGAGGNIDIAAGTSVQRTGGNL
jgi:hypothetical protein